MEAVCCAFLSKVLSRTWGKPVATVQLGEPSQSMDGTLSRRSSVAPCRKSTAKSQGMVTLSTAFLRECCKIPLESLKKKKNKVKRYGQHIPRVTDLYASKPGDQGWFGLFN